MINHHQGLQHHQGKEVRRESPASTDPTFLAGKSRFPVFLSETQNFPKKGGRNGWRDWLSQTKDTGTSWMKHLLSGEAQKNIWSAINVLSGLNWSPFSIQATKSYFSWEPVQKSRTF